MSNSDRGATPYTMAIAILAVAAMMLVPVMVSDDDGDVYGLTAKPTYTVVFHGNGAEQADWTVTVNEGVTIQLPVTSFTRENHYLMYWDDGSKDYQPGEDFTVWGDTTFNAEWGSTNGTHRSDIVWEVGKTLEFDIWEIAGGTGEIKGVTMPDWLHTVDVSSNHLWRGSIDKPGVWYVAFNQTWFGINPTYYWFTIVIPSSMDTSYTVSFDTNFSGGSGTINKSEQLENVSAPIGTTVTLPQFDSIEMQGHTFRAWGVMLNGTPTYYAPGAEYTINPDHLDSASSDTITFEAYWEPYECGIVFNPFGAQGISFDHVEYGEPLKLIATTETWEGKTFAGWTVWDEPDVIIPINTEYIVTEDDMMNGYWIPNGTTTYSIVFDVGDGGIGGLSVQIEPGKRVFLPETGMISGNGDVFAGWSLSEGGKPIEPDADGAFTPSGSLTLHALWVPNEKPVTGIQINGTGVVNVGETIRLTAITTPTDATDRAVVWNVVDTLGCLEIVDEGVTDSGGWIELKGVVAGSVEVRAVAADGSGTQQSKTITILGEEQTFSHTLTYDPNQGQGGPGSRTVSSGTQGSYTFTISSTEPTRDGYTFLGWADTADATYPKYHWDSSKGYETTVTVTKERTIYAVWQQNEVVEGEREITITYNANGIVWPGTSSEVVTDVVKTTEDSITIAIGSPPTRVGYQFAGWSTDSEASPDSEELLSPGDMTEITDDITYYAIWKEVQNTFTLNFDAREGSGAPSTITKTTSAMTAAFEIPTDIPVNGDKVFLGWSVNEFDAVGTYGHGEGLIDIYRMSTSTMGTSKSETLYAIWGQAQHYFSVTFYPNGGEGGPDKLEYTGGPTETIHEFVIEFGEGKDPTRDRFIFLGWGTEPNSKGPSYNSVYNTITVNYENNERELYAVWSPVPETESITLTLDPGVSGLESIVMTGELVDGVCVFDIPTEVDPDLPEYAGHTLMGFSLEKGGDVAIALGDSYPLSESATIYAVWRSDTVEIVLHFDDKGGYNGPPDIVKKASVGESVPFEIPGYYPQKDGWTCIGWSTSENSNTATIFAGDKDIYLSGDTTIHAVYVENSESIEYRLEFDLRGGQAQGLEAIVWSGYTETHDFMIPQIIPTDSSGKQFAGWSLDAQADSGDYGAGGTITVYAADPKVTLYAIWTESAGTTSHLVTFVSGGGDSVPPQLVASGGHVVRPDDPGREGFTFEGWYLDGASEPFDFDTYEVTEPITIHAKWKAVLESDPDDDTDDDTDSDKDEDGTGQTDDNDPIKFLWAVLAVMAVALLVIALFVRNIAFLVSGVLSAVLAVAAYLLL